MEDSMVRIERSLFDIFFVLFSPYVMVEWYRGRIVIASSSFGRYDVQYDDGDYDESLCRSCVRPYRPLELGERVEMRINGQTWTVGQIVAVNHEALHYDVETSTDDLRKGVPVTDIRRYDSTFDSTLKVGSIVEAKFQGQGENWYRGEIVKVSEQR
jgi:hypothetical protein